MHPFPSPLAPCPMFTLAWSHRYAMRRRKRNRKLERETHEEWRHSITTGRQPPGRRASETIRNKRPPGADISFSIPRAPIDDSDPSHTHFPPPRFQHALLRVIFLSHIPSCAFITFKRAWEKKLRALTLFLFFKTDPPILLSPSFSPILPLFPFFSFFLSFFFSKLPTAPLLACVRECPFLFVSLS